MVDTEEGKGNRGRKLIFVFDNEMNSVKDLKAQYYSRKAKVPALSYVDEIRALKNLTHGILSGG